MLESKTDVLDTYRTIESIAEGLYKDKGSKFLSFAYHVDSESEITPIINNLKKDHFAARHHCFAWRLGFKGEKMRMVDDGEPSSTAGKPILGQILSYDLTNILVVVVRYFGGTKLGVSGLIQAYKQAAQDAINNAVIETKTIDVYYSVVFDYLMMNDVMKIVKDIAPNIINQEFNNECCIVMSIRESEKDILEDRLSKLRGVKVMYNNISI